MEILQDILILLLIGYMTIDQNGPVVLSWFSVIVGMIAGLIMGDMNTGLVIGGTFQLMSLGVAALGGASAPNYGPATIMGSIAGYMAQQGNPLGAIIWLICNIIFWFVKRKMFAVGYTSGTKLITNLGQRLSTFTEAASIMGLSVVGALIATSVKVSTALQFQIGEVALNLQTDVLDKIMPSLLPVLLTALVYKLLGNKKWTPTKLILLIIAISLVGSFFGIFAV